MYRLVTASTILLFLAGCSAKTNPDKGPAVESDEVDFKPLDPQPPADGGVAEDEGEATLD